MAAEQNGALPAPIPEQGNLAERVARLERAQAQHHDEAPHNQMLARIELEQGNLIERVARLETAQAQHHDEAPQNYEVRIGELEQKVRALEEAKWHTSALCVLLLVVAIGMGYHRISQVSHQQTESKKNMTEYFKDMLTNYSSDIEGKLTNHLETVLTEEDIERIFDDFVTEDDVKHMLSRHLETVVSSFISERFAQLVQSSKFHPSNRYKTISVDPPLLPMTRFSIHKKEGSRWTSNPLYTHHQGYKVCLRVIANGTSFGKGTHVSVFIHFMRGEFDDSLKWPFRGVISFKLLDQIGDNHILRHVTYDDNVADSTCTRVTEGEVGKGEWGYIKFIAHSDLDPKYLKDDTLIFQIHEVELH